ncbi:MAG: hypothetical protein M1827_007564 [Pycnora praestabilis]|nr:MAG: hypothetical protein M1827_007564 [Pycnora praestabilis]
MDALSTMPSFSGAFNTFLSLQKLDTKCAITLLGWSSPGGSTIGQEVWEGDRTATEGYERFPELEQFKGGEEARGFSLSAIFEVLESAAGSDAPLTVRGSAVLTEATRRAATAHASSAGNKAVTVESGGYVSKRVPFVTIQGTDAGTLARVTIERYSEYVAALFENFD